MSAVLEIIPPKTRKTSIDTTEKLILHDVSWETYNRLVQDQMGKSQIRLSYNDGDLQIMVESAKHGKLAGILGEIVSEIGDLLELDFITVGSATFRKEEGRKGFEPDDSFYFQYADLIRRKEDIDLDIDPPPELIIEVDVTSPSLPRFPIFAEVGVQEIWRYDGTSVIFYSLQKNGKYQEIRESICLPKVKSEIVTNLLEMSFEMKRLEWIKLIRQSIE